MSSQVDGYQRPNAADLVVTAGDALRLVTPSRLRSSMW
jgi:hypothetical protein